MSELLYWPQLLSESVGCVVSLTETGEFLLGPEDFICRI